MRPPLPPAPDPLALWLLLPRQNQLAPPFSIVEEFEAGYGLGRFGHFSGQWQLLGSGENDESPLISTACRWTTWTRPLLASLGRQPPGPDKSSVDTCCSW
jgi:hypothetical protein